MYTGTYFLALRMGDAASKIIFLALKYIRYAITPEIAGVIIQLPTTPPTLPQATASTDTPTAVKPTIAPMIECVVETGQPK